MHGYGLRRYLVKKWLSGDDYPIMLVSEGVGVGKSSIVRQASKDLAKELGLNFVEVSDEYFYGIPKRPLILLDVNLLTMEAWDLRGVPKVEGSRFRYARHFVEQIFDIDDAVFVILFDDFSWVTNQSVRVVFNRVLIKRELFGRPLPDEAYIVATANNNIRLEEPLRDRFEWVFVDSPTVNEWIAYMDEMFGDAWYRLVGAFLKTNPNALLWKEAQCGEFVFDSPRSWTGLARRLHHYERKFGISTIDEIKDIVFGFVSKESGAKFLAWLAVQREVGDVFKYFEDFDRYVELRPDLKPFIIQQYVNEENNIIRLRDVLVKLAEIDGEGFLMAWGLMPLEKKRKVLTKLPNSIIDKYSDIIRLYREVVL